MMKRMDELVFEVVQEADGGYCAECLTESIFTQADSWDELRRNVIEAVNAFYFDRTAPASVRLHLVRDEVLSVARRSRAISRANNSQMFCASTGNTFGVHQVGSHIILETSAPSHHRIAVPAHQALRVGTLNSILRSVAQHKGVTREAILDTL